MLLNADYFMKILPFKAIYPNLNLITSPDLFFGSVKNDYTVQVKSGFFKKDNHEAIYIYKITSQHGTHTGIIACNDISDILDNNILRHEHTLASKEQSMINLILERKAMIKPVLLAYDKVESLSNFKKEITESRDPFLNIFFEADNETHTLWQITDKEEISFIQENFKKNIRKTYIADGHHRCYTTLHLFEKKDFIERKNELNSILAVYFPFEELKIYDFNRIVTLNPEMSSLAFMAAITKYFKIKKLNKPTKPSKKFEITLSIEREWYLLKWKRKVLKEYMNDMVVLDANILDEKIMNSVLGILDVKTDNRIKYQSGNMPQEEVYNMLNKTDKRIGLFLFPVLAEELKEVSRAGLTMPPKSTWFEPRIKNGVLVKEI
jgi:uncharacterized protein (DUF1015 family)